MQGTIGGTAGLAHIGPTAGAYYNSKNGTLNIKFQENLGLGFGEKGAFKIEIPLPFTKN